MCIYFFHLSVFIYIYPYLSIYEDYDPSTKKGFLLFIFPLILDGIFTSFTSKYKVLSSCLFLGYKFSGNTISMLQNDKLTFSSIQKKKRKDRIIQLSFLALSAVGTLYVGQRIGIFIFALLSSSFPSFSKKHLLR